MAMMSVEAMRGTTHHPDRLDEERPQRLQHRGFRPEQNPDDDSSDETDRDFVVKLQGAGNLSQRLPPCQLRDNQRRRDHSPIVKERRKLGAEG